jgi:hypothetical protein
MPSPETTLGNHCNVHSNDPSPAHYQQQQQQQSPNIHPQQQFQAQIQHHLQSLPSASAGESCLRIVVCQAKLNQGVRREFPISNQPMWKK